jgi:Activator of Hsp90 ATPase homolog 1-like protein
MPCGSVFRASGRPLSGARRPHSTSRPATPERRPSERDRAGAASPHGAAVVHETHPSARGQRLDSQSQERPSANVHSARETPDAEACLAAQRQLWQARTDRLERFVTTQTRGPRVTIAVTNPEPNLSISRIMKAPRSVVWSAWTERETFELWWVPAPARCRVLEMDLRPGGSFVTQIQRGGWGVQTSHQRLLPADQRLRKNRVHRCPRWWLATVRSPVHDRDHHASGPSVGDGVRCKRVASQRCRSKKP